MAIYFTVHSKLYIMILIKLIKISNLQQNVEKYLKSKIYHHTVFFCQHHNHHTVQLYAHLQTTSSAVHTIFFFLILTQTKI